MSKYGHLSPRPGGSPQQRTRYFFDSADWCSEGQTGKLHPVAVPVYCRVASASPVAPTPTLHVGQMPRVRKYFDSGDQPLANTARPGADVHPVVTMRLQLQASRRAVLPPSTTLMGPCVGPASS